MRWGRLSWSLPAQKTHRSMPWSENKLGFPLPSMSIYRKKKTEYYEEEIERVDVEHGAKLLPGKKDINVTLLFFSGYLYKIGENLFFINN